MQIFIFYLLAVVERATKMQQTCIHT